MTHEASPPDRQDRRKAIEALPVVGDIGMLGTRAAMAALFDIKHSNKKLYEHIRGQMGSVREDFAEALSDREDANGNYVLSPAMLRGIIARSVLAGGTQVAYDIGSASLHVALLREITGLWSDDLDATSDLPEEETS
ncbi:MAG: hypothetical protein ACQR33_00680 [Candidatus Saccharibacteria bacterium]